MCRKFSTAQPKESSSKAVYMRYPARATSSRRAFVSAHGINVAQSLRSFLGRQRWMQPFPEGDALIMLSGGRECRSLPFSSLLCSVASMRKCRK